LFGDVFRDLPVTIALLDRAVPLRNAVRHHRDVSPAQYALLVGIAGEVEDAISIWYAGATLHHTETTMQFTRLLPTDGRAAEETLAESRDVVLGLAEKVVAGFASGGYDSARVEHEVAGAYENRLKAGHDTALIRTSADARSTYGIAGKPYKGVHVTYVQKRSSRLSLTTIVRALGIPYQSIAYTLPAALDIPRLEALCQERSGLRYSSASSMGQGLTSLEYTFLSGALRIGVENEANGSAGVIRASCESGFTQAHTYMLPQNLVGFLVGDVPPRAVKYLLDLSKAAPDR